MAHMARTSAAILSSFLMWRLSRDLRPYRSMAFWQRVVHIDRTSMTSRRIPRADVDPRQRLKAIGLTNEPRLLDPADPLAGLPGLEQTGWKRELAGVLCERALARVAQR